MYELKCVTLFTKSAVGGFSVNALESSTFLVGSVPRMIPVKALNGVSGREEVIKLFIVTGGAECVMPLRL